MWLPFVTSDRGTHSRKRYHMSDLLNADITGAIDRCCRSVAARLCREAPLSLLAQSGHRLVRCTCPLMTQSGHRLVRCTCLLLTQSGHGAKTYSARHANGRGSTRRPKAQLPPRQTALVDPIYWNCGHLVLSKEAHTRRTTGSSSAAAILALRKRYWT